MDSGQAGAGDRASARPSTGGSGTNSSRLRSSAAGASAASAGSAFAAANAMPSNVSSDMDSAFSNQAGVSDLVTELDSLDLSGAAAVRGHNRRSSKGGMQQMAQASGSTATAGYGSATSSQLEEQPTIVEPPPEVDLYRQPSSSPFSTCQGPAFGDAE
jgi:hypothetical protein